MDIFYKALCKESASELDFCQLFAQFLCIPKSAAEGISSIASLLQLSNINSKESSDSICINNPLINQDVECKKFFELTLDCVETFAKSTQLSDVQYLISNTNSFISFFKDVKQRILRCFGYFIAIQLLRGLYYDLQVLGQNIEANHQTVDENMTLLGCSIESVLETLVNEPFEQAKFFIIQQVPAFSQIVNPLLKLMHSQSGQTRLEAIKRLLGLENITETLLQKRNDINLALLDPVPAIQQQVLKLIQKHFSDLDFENIGILACCQEKQLRSAVFKLKPNLQQTAKLLEGCDFQTVDFILDEQKQKFKVEEFADYCSEIESEHQLMVAISFVNRVFTDNAEFLTQALKRFQHQIPNLESFDGIEQIVAQTEHHGLIDGGQQLMSELLTHNPAAISKMIPKIYPTTDEMITFVKQADDKFQNIIVLFALKLKSVGIFDYSLFDALANRFNTNFQALSFQMESDKQLGDVQYNELTKYVDKSNESTTNILSLLQGFPRSFGLEQDLGRRLMTSLLRIFTQLYQLKYQCYSNIDITKDERIQYIIELVDEIERKIIQELGKVEQSVSNQLFLTSIDLPVLKQQFKTVFNQIDANNVFQYTVALFKHIQTVIDTEHVVQLDIQKEAANIVTTLLKGKTTHEYKKEWIKIAMWGIERGVIGLGKGLGDDGEKILKDWEDKQK